MRLSPNAEAGVSTGAPNRVETDDRGTAADIAASADQVNWGRISPFHFLRYSYLHLNHFDSNKILVLCLQNLAEIHLVND